MKKDTTITEVQFLVNDKEHGFDDVFAFFPKENYNDFSDQTKNSYTHIGQHGPCHVDYAAESRPATPEEYKDLKSELESLGYNLKIVQL